MKLGAAPEIDRHTLQLSEPCPAVATSLRVTNSHGHSLALLSEPPKSPSIPIKRYGLSRTLQQSHQVYGFDLLSTQLVGI